MTRAPGYVLELEPDQLDLNRFETLVAESTRQPPETAAELLREALELWRQECSDRDRRRAHSVRSASTSVGKGRERLFKPEHCVGVVTIGRDQSE